MSNKILVESSGLYQAISASYDDNAALSSSLPLTLNTASYVGKTGLMQIYNKQLLPVPATSISEPQGNYSGSVLAYTASEGFAPLRLGEPSFTGDISGNLINDIKVVSVSNVQSGILSSQYGGTSGDIFTSDSLVLATGSGPVFGQNDQIPVTIDNIGSWQLNNKNVLNGIGLSSNYDVYLYTGSVGVNNTYTWIKPSGYRFFRIVCQGGGGGGGSGFRSIPNTYFFGNGGGGGGGGGYSDIVINADLIPSTVTITAGMAGLGGTLVQLGTAGSGGNSSFGTIVSANGGGGGKNGDLSNTYTAQLIPRRSTGGAGGVGFTVNGGAGGAGGERSILNQDPNGGAAGMGLPGTSVTLGGAGGGGGGRMYNRFEDGGGVGGAITSADLGAGPSFVTWGVPPVSPPVGSFFKSILTVKQGVVNTSNVNTVNLPNILSSGGGGGGSYIGTNTSDVRNITGAQGASSFFGSGGGGSGGAYYTGTDQGSGRNGGNGGVGYVLIICY